MSAEKRPNEDPGPSNGEPQAKRQEKGEDGLVFYPNYGIPEGDLPSDAAILESNDGYHFYCPLEDLAEGSSFFRDLLSLGLVSDTTTAKTKSPVGTALPVIPLPRVSSVAMGLIISTFTPAKPDYVDKAAVVKDIRAVITAAEYLNLDCWRLRNIACCCWDWDQKPYPHEEFAITCALSSHPCLLAEIAGRTHREPLRGEKLVKVQAMMADQTLYSDFFEGLKVAHECHCGDQERIEIALENINSVGIERTFRKKCWPKGYQPDGCKSFQIYDGNFDRIIYNAAMTVLAHLSDRGLRPEGYPDHYIASEL